MRWYVVHAYSGFEKSVARNLAEDWRRRDERASRLVRMIELEDQSA